MKLNSKIALSATVAIVIGSSSLYAETNTSIPQIPNEINVSIINNNTGSAVSALPPSIQLNGVGVTTGVNKNTKLGLHLNSVNMSTVTLQADSSVTLIKETDFLYAKFAKSGSHTITAIGKAIDGSDINASVTFDVVNRAPISNSKTFVINANEILKFDAYTYFLDEDDENLTFNKASLPVQGSLEINNNRVSYYPTSTTAGYIATFDVNGTDIEGSSTSSTFTVNVSAESEKINLINGWNLLGNSAREGMNVSDINISGESIWAYIDGTWSQSMTTIESKQGFWLKTNSQRVLEVKPNGDTTEFNTSAPFGWKLVADTEAKTLKRLKFGNDAVWTFKEKTWFNANNYPDFEVERYRGFWTLNSDEITPIVLAGSTCKTILDGGGSVGDGVYTINPEGNNSFDAYCDMTTDGGGWTLAMKGKKYTASASNNRDLAYNGGDISACNDMTPETCFNNAYNTVPFNEVLGMFGSNAQLAFYSDSNISLKNLFNVGTQFTVSKTVPPSRPASFWLGKRTYSGGIYEAGTYYINATFDSGTTTSQTVTGNCTWISANGCGGASYNHWNGRHHNESADTWFFVR